MNIYIDESGDLGSAQKSGKYFIIALVGIKNPRDIDIWMRRIRSKKQKNKEKKLSEIKANQASNIYKKYFYKHLQDLDFQVVIVIIEKLKISKHLKKEQGLIYFHGIKEGIANLVNTKDKQLLITIDRRHFQKFSKEGFNIALKEFLLFHSKTNAKIKIHHIDSTTNRLLQFTDFVAYAANRKYNAKDNSWHCCLKRFIIKEKILKIKQ